MQRWLAVWLLCGAGWAAAQTEPIVLGTHKEPFVDRFLIDTCTQCDLQLQAPVPAGTALAFDAPWEGAFSGYVTMVQEAGRIRAYYRGLPVSGKDGSDGEVTCVAESTDGVVWSKPALTLFPIPGFDTNNIVLAGQAPYSHNFAPFLDTRPDVPPAARYKALAGTSTTGLHAFYSEDGLAWHKAGESAVITQGAFDSQNVAFWSIPEQVYVCYFRTWSQGAWEGYRSVSRCTSPDFVHWSDPVPMRFGDTPMEHLYTNQTTPYPGAPQLYAGIAARFMPGRRVISEAQAITLKIDPGYFGDCSDGVLLTSRGGTSYDRTFMEGYIRPGIGPEYWTSRTNYPARGIVVNDENTWSIYVQADYGQPGARLDRYTLRADGIASLRAPYAGGSMTTRPLTFEGSALVLNFATSAAGSIRVAVLEESGQPRPGFGLEDCAALIGNEIARTVAWKDGSSVAALAGTTVRLQFEMQDADLFALHFE